MAFQKLKTLEFAEWDDVRDHMRSSVDRDADHTFMLLLKRACYNFGSGLYPIMTKDLEAEARHHHENTLAKFFREEFGDELWIRFRFTPIDYELYPIPQQDDWI